MVSCPTKNQKDPGFESRDELAVSRWGLPYFFTKIQLSATAVQREAQGVGDGHTMN